MSILLSSDFSDDLDMNMAKLTSDLYFTQLSEIQGFSVTDRRSEFKFKEYENLAKVIISRTKSGKCFNFFHFMIDLEQGPCAIKRLRGCSCGNEYLAITPYGDIYPCHQFVGDIEFKMGNVNSGEFDVNIKKFFSIPNLISSDECKNCWAKFFCGGGCSANNWNFNKKIDKPHELSCNLMKKRVEMSIVISSNL